MKKMFLSFVMMGAAFIVGAQQTYNFNWGKSIVGATASGGFLTINIDQSYSTVDVNQNSYTVGSFNGTVDFDPSSAVSNLTAINNGNSNNIFLNKLNSAGSYVWTKQFVATGNYRVFKAAADNNGDVIIIGLFTTGTIDCDPGLGVYNLTASIVPPALSSDNFFIIKLNSSGNFIWAKQFAGNGTNYPTPIVDYTNQIDLEINSINDIYISSQFTQTMDFDPSSAVNNLVSPTGKVSSFICKLNNLGNLQWVKNFYLTSSLTNSLFPPSICLNPINNEVVFTGVYSGTMDIDPGPNVTSITSANPYGGAYISKWDNNGNFIWVKNLGYSSFSADIKVNQLGDIYFASGGTAGDFDPGPGTVFLTSFGGGSKEDVFISKYSSLGIFLWVKQIGGADTDSPVNLEIDNSNNIFVSIPYRNTVDFNPSPTCVFNLTTPPLKDNFGAVKLDVNGNFLWAGNIYNGGRGGFHNYILVKGNSLYFFGNCADTPDLNPLPAIYNAPFGFSDMYSSKITLCTTIGCATSTDPCSPPPARMALNTSSVISDIDSKWSLFPNPSNGAFTLDLGKEFKQANVRITNVTGKVLAEYQYKDLQKTALQFDGAPGFYWLDITTEEGKLPRMKLMKD
jgi:Secretion system C-terminal sorting domain